MLPGFICNTVMRCVGVRSVNNVEQSLLVARERGERRERVSRRGRGERRERRKSTA